MSEILTIDLETRSAVDLRKTGVYPYAEDPSTGVWCAGWAVGDEPVQIWREREKPPERIVDHVRSGGHLAAWNANFEIGLWRGVLGPRHGWPIPDLRQWRCSMTYAYAMALPGSLENAGAALGVAIQKDLPGRRLMLQMAQPRRPKKGEPTDQLLWWDDEARLERLYEYCKQDVEVERLIRARLVALRPSEVALWHLDQEINSRGITVDADLCRKAKEIVAIVEKRLDREMALVTEWDVTACSNLNQLKTWLRSKNVNPESLDREAIEELLITELPADVRRALELRAEAAKASVKKIEALLNGMSADGRARGLLQFHAASTGRWAGRRVQPQNFKRAELPSEEIADAIDTMMRFPAKEATSVLEMIYGPPLSVIGDCMKGMLRAAPRKKLVTADFSNIEGRVIAWLAGEDQKLDKFRAFDAGTGPDIYLATAAGILGVPVSSLSKKSPERQSHGKVPELACGFQGGVGAFQAMAHTYRVTIADEDAAEIVKGWRDDHPNIRQMWWDLDNAGKEAVEHPGQVVRCGKVKFKVSGSFLWLQLPSGRSLCYPYPKVVAKEMPWLDADDRPVWKDVVSYKGVDTYTRQWTTIYTYGGKWAENITQAVARDLMAEAMVRAEAAGYSMVLTVHDELVAEVDEGFGSIDEFIPIMTTLPPWATGLPVAADGWEGPRYKKG